MHPKYLTYTQQNYTLKNLAMKQTELLSKRPHSLNQTEFATSIDKQNLALHQTELLSKNLATNLATNLAN